jgi:chromosome segregation ATPase
MNPFDFEITTLQTIGAKSELGSASDGRAPEIESHLNRLWSLWKRLESITDRASDVRSRSLGRSQDLELLATAALREAECADLIEQSMETELTSLRSELKQKDETLQAQEIALVQLEETSKAKLAELENHIQNQENQFRDREMERQQLTSERDRIVLRLNDAELAAKWPEAEAQVCSLSLEIAKRQDSVAAREPDLRCGEGDQKTDIESLQLRLQDAEAKLATQERELHQKESVIGAAAVKETEIGKLIERLSSECEKLSAELCEKQFIISRLEDTTSHSFINSVKAWGKTLRVVQFGRLLSGRRLIYESTKRPAKGNTILGESS